MQSVLTFLIMILVLVGGFGLIIGGPDLAMRWEKKILKWSWKHFSRLGKKLIRWSGKQIARFVRWIWVKLKA